MLSPCLARVVVAPLVSGVEAIERQVLSFFSNRAAVVEWLPGWEAPPGGIGSPAGVRRKVSDRSSSFPNLSGGKNGEAQQRRPRREPSSQKSRPSDAAT